MGASMAAPRDVYPREANAFAIWHCGRKDWAPFADRCYPPEVADKMKATQMAGVEVLGYTVVWGNDFASFGPVLAGGSSVLQPCCSQREGSAGAAVAAGRFRPVVDVVFEPRGRSSSSRLGRRHKLLDAGAQRGLCAVSLVAVITDLRRSTVRLCFYSAGSAGSDAGVSVDSPGEDRGAGLRRGGRLGSLLVPVLSGASRTSDAAVSLEAHALRRRFLEQWRPAAVVRRALLPERQPSTGSWGAALPHDHVSLNLRDISEADWALLTSTWPAWDATLHGASVAVDPARGQARAEDPRLDTSFVPGPFGQPATPRLAAAQRAAEDQHERDDLTCCAVPISARGAPPQGMPSPRYEPRSQPVRD